MRCRWPTPSRSASARTDSSSRSIPSWRRFPRPPTESSLPARARAAKDISDTVGAGRRAAAQVLALLGREKSEGRQTSSMIKTRIIGLGNTILSDDGVGVYAARDHVADPR